MGKNMIQISFADVTLTNNARKTHIWLSPIMPKREPNLKKDIVTAHQLCKQKTQDVQRNLF